MNANTRRALTCTCLLGTVVITACAGGTASGKDYRPLSQPVGMSSSGSGVQPSLLARLGTT
jgi:hypothetical protein